MINSWKRLLPLFFLLLTLNACAYEPEDPGQCKLTCESAIIGANDLQMSIKVKSEIPAVTCQIANAGQPVGGMRASFLIGESIKDQNGNEIAVRPVPNISVEPIIVGVTANIGNGETNPAHQSVVTPRANWCSDACGVVAMEFVPLCPGPASTTDAILQLHSGALFSDPATFKISTESPPSLR